jgi:hypothetical protein
MDNLSAATHELRKTGGRTLTSRFKGVLDHFKLDASRIQPGEAHENGVVEKGHDLFKSNVDQALRIRGNRDFPTVEAYLAFVAHVVERDLHAGRGAKLAEERAALRPLPSTRLPEYTRLFAQVRRWSTIQVVKRPYSVAAHRPRGRSAPVRRRLGRKGTDMGTS